MARKLFSFPLDVNYGASKTSSSANAATNPYDLAVGALGIFGIQPTNRKLELVVDGTAKDYAGIIVAVGTATGADVSDTLDVKDLKCTSRAYNAATKSVKVVGFHPTLNASGLLNLPTAIKSGDEAIVILNDENDKDRYLMVGKNYSGYAKKDADSAYNILADMQKRINGDEYGIAKMEIFSNGTATAIVQPTHFTGSGTAQIALTNGSDQAVVSSAGISATSIVAGNLLRLGGATYTVKAVSAVAANAFTITLDRPYLGATQSATNVSTTTGAVLTSVTEYGFTLTDAKDDMMLSVSVSGAIESAVVVQTTAPIRSNGKGTVVAAYEESMLPWVGAGAATIDRTLPLKGLLTDPSLTYDLYTLTATNYRPTSDPHGDRMSPNKVELQLAFLSTVADTGGKNQSNFEDILGDLNVSYVSLF